ncbi:hypothetical protein MA16_Dca019209 [Dendrobium catenatum]|uniref:Uncharacterized protein n=1 Tax=Dendrobium catenatum TaxID=906689 RepID=A0A2I0WKE3_9ASPA|nr:hypothetical protein MA16_Dca019209 [Dendrobium catenatum]
MKVAENKEEEDKIVRREAEIPNVLPIIAESVEPMQGIQKINSVIRLTDPVDVVGNMLYLNSNLNSNSEFKIPEIKEDTKVLMLPIQLMVLKFRELTNLCLNSILQIFRR